MPVAESQAKIRKASESGAPSRMARSISERASSILSYEAISSRPYFAVQRREPSRTCAFSSIPTWILVGPINSSNTADKDQRISMHREMMD